MLLIRHTAVVAQSGVCYGRSEVPVAESFPADVEMLIAVLRERLLSFAVLKDGESSRLRIWTSPAARCRVAADALRERWGEVARQGVEPELRVDARLAELNFGAWEGQAWETLRGPEVDAWMNDPWLQRPPGGETAQEMWARVGAFREERRAEERILENGNGTHDLVVTHAGVIRAWRSLAERRVWRELFAEKIPFGSAWLAE